MIVDISINKLCCIVTGGSDCSCMDEYWSHVGGYPIRWVRNLPDEDICRTTCCAEQDAAKWQWNHAHGEFCPGYNSQSGRGQ